MRPGQAAPVFEAFVGVARRDRDASMRPGQAAPVFCPGQPFDLEVWQFASMRPGQAAPVFAAIFDSERRRPERFNEAGAGCPGIRRYLYLFELSG